MGCTECVTLPKLELRAGLRLDPGWVDEVLDAKRMGGHSFHAQVDGPPPRERGGDAPYSTEKTDDAHCRQDQVHRGKAPAW